jgi:hypothetical protein
VWERFVREADRLERTSKRIGQDGKDYFGKFAASSQAAHFPF